MYLVATYFHHSFTDISTNHFLGMERRGQLNGEIARACGNVEYGLRGVI